MKNHENYESFEIARKLHISVKTLRNKLSRRDRNLPPSFRVGRKRLFPAKEFEKWFDKKQETNFAKNLNQYKGEVE
jgi:hypothetical protein